MRRVSRRAFTLSATAGLLFGAFANPLVRPAQAAGSVARRRLLIFHSMGTRPELWTPRNVKSQESFDLTPSTQPLASIRANSLFIDGLDSGNPSNGHDAPDALTGLGFGWEGRGLRSVDQFIADRLKEAGDARPVPTLITGGLERTAFYRGGYVPAIQSPVSVYKAVFGVAQPGAGDPAPERLLARRKSVLDNVKSELAELEADVGSEARARLQLHAESIRQLENALATNGSSAAGCVQAPEPADPGANLLTGNKLNLDLIVTAFACGITRVAGVQWGRDAQMPVDLPEVGLQGEQHNFIHGGAPNYEKLVPFEAWLCDRFVELIEKLRRTPEPDGSGTLLDNTLVAWTRDMGDAHLHNQTNMRYVLATGNAGHFATATTGRYLTLPGVRHERLLLSLCDWMGVSDFNGFGDAGMPNRTPLSELR